eukprot:2726802-Prymnesium_polylepis.1
MPWAVAAGHARQDGCDARDDLGAQSPLGRRVALSHRRNRRGRRGRGGGDAAGRRGAHCHAPRASHP